MPRNKAVLLAGEISRGPNGTTLNGALQFIAALNEGGYAVTQLSVDECGEHFPLSVAEMGRYGALVLSDVGALSLLLTLSARGGNLGTDRLQMLSDWVATGGGLVMAGGYMSFLGLDGLARYYETPKDDRQPDQSRPNSDGLEAPAGLVPLVLMPHHPVLRDIGTSWPPLLGMNKTEYRNGASAVQIIAECTYLERRFPLLATRTFGKGRFLVWFCVFVFYWLSQAFASWHG